MIGLLYISVPQFYDISKHKLSFKKRPVLIISEPRNNDYIVLPLSTISNSSNIDNEYDIKIDPQKYPSLNLAKISYVRTHKSFAIHEKELIKEIANLKELEPNLYSDILSKHEQWTKKVIIEAL